MIKAFLLALSPFLIIFINNYFKRKEKYDQEREERERRRKP